MTIGDPSVMATARNMTARANFARCPKCGGQHFEASGFRRCYQCSFEWDPREAAGDVGKRALVQRVKHRAAWDPALDALDAENLDTGSVHLPGSPGSRGRRVRSRRLTNFALRLPVIGTQAGLTRVEQMRLVKEWLALGLSDLRLPYPLNSDEPTETGRAYGAEAVDAGEVWCAFGLRSPHEQRILTLWLGPERLALVEVAARLGVSEAQAAREVYQAIETMARQVWDE